MPLSGDGIAATAAAGQIDRQDRNQVQSESERTDFRRIIARRLRHFQYACNGMHYTKINNAVKILNHYGHLFEIRKDSGLNVLIS